MILILLRERGNNHLKQHKELKVEIKDFVAVPIQIAPSNIIKNRVQNLEKAVELDYQLGGVSKRKNPKLIAVIRFHYQHHLQEAVFMGGLPGGAIEANKGCLWCGCTYS
ncbi:hypothetical protein NC653_000014 [Populus alba x Populus x berolinensis]|uniref:Uncharacterized protein n=1 Tax=Populus alba x Populus x berolinensis TaxID=444605 RepID=A0AAD6WET7_9ROSI|nr:hypothetical protein NC653_000014 [Populus alba x Populus x berolinensis]